MKDALLIDTLRWLALETDLDGLEYSDDNDDDEPISVSDVLTEAAARLEAMAHQLAGQTNLFPTPLKVCPAPMRWSQDQYHCGECKLVWDTDEPRPECLPAKE